MKKMKELVNTNFWAVKVLWLFIRLIVAMAFYSAGTVVYFSMLLIGGVASVVYSVADKCSEHKLTKSIVDKSLGILGFRLSRIEE